MAEGLVALLCAAITVVTFFYWVPWMGKLMAIYGLHGLRDRIYNASHRFPQALDTRLYRNAEFCLTAEIKVVRDSRWGVWAFLSALWRPPGHNARLRAIYERERETVFTGADGQFAHDEIVRAVVDSRPYLYVRAMTINPLVQLVGVLFLIAKVVGSAGRSDRERQPIAETVSRHFQTSRRSIADRPDLSQLLHWRKTDSMRDGGPAVGA